MTRSSKGGIPARPSGFQVLRVNASYNLLDSKMIWDHPYLFYFNEKFYHYGHLPHSFCRHTKGDQLKFKHASRGSKLIDLKDAFECAFHMFACKAQVLNQNYMLVWCMLVVGLNDEMKSSMHR